MSFPPLGYDDENIIAQSRLKSLLGQLEKDLDKIQEVVFERLQGEEKVSTDVEQIFSALSCSAEELQPEYSFLVEKLISDYRHFKDQPSHEKLDQLFSDIKSFQLFLVG